MTALQTFDFHGDQLDVVVEDDNLFVSIKRVCEALGIDRRTQQVKLKNYDWAVGGLITSTGSDGKSYQMSMIDIRSLPMWLATIHPNRVAEEVRPKLIRYQREAADVLADHFLGPRVPVGATTIEERKQRLAEGKFLLKLVAEAAKVTPEQRAPYEQIARHIGAELVIPDGPVVQSAARSTRKALSLPDEDTDKVREWLKQHPAAEIRVIDVCRGVFDVENPTHSQKRRVGQIMRMLGWTCHSAKFRDPNNPGKRLSVRVWRNSAKLWPRN